MAWYLRVTDSCIIAEKNGFAFKYYWQVGYIPDKADEMRVRLLTEICWGRQVCVNIDPWYF